MVEARFLRAIHSRSGRSNNFRQTVSSSEKYRHQNSWKTRGLFHLKSRIALSTGSKPRTKPIKIMNTIGTQVLMANGISRRRFLVDSTGIATVADLSLTINGTDTNQSGLAPMKKRSFIWPPKKVRILFCSISINKQTHRKEK
jgi:hypothetical protein